MASRSAQYVLHYWPGIPGRGEFIRLAFESVSHPYTEKNDPKNLVGLLMNTGQIVGHPAHFAPPILEIKNSGSQSASSFISQTPAILAYLAPLLGLDGTSTTTASSTSKSEASTSELAIRRAQVNQLTLNALDLNNETHDVHHPIAPGDYYEGQKSEASRRAVDFRKTRVPKFFKLFQLTLEANFKAGWLIGDHLTTADLALFQVVDGLHFAFPRLIATLKKSGDYDQVFTLHQKVAAIDNISKYLKSDRRVQYSNGIFRHYPELDGEM